ncbi:hypothetical protein FACHB389_01675 [Nostoc calcicola FACHB-389]|nr:hypothetical protein FACHB389_01675 [Nostoc calcicola FACHB-389]
MGHLKGETILDFRFWILDYFGLYSAPSEPNKSFHRKFKIPKPYPEELGLIHWALLNSGMNLLHAETLQAQRAKV